MNNFYKWFFLVIGTFFTVQVLGIITGGISIWGALLIIITTIIWLLFCIFVIRSSKKYRKQNNIGENN